ncbi:MAG: putative bifunctional diguanylate cyclase/phosphodiesterase [Acidimicrobiales bacterium]
MTLIVQDDNPASAHLWSELVDADDRIEALCQVRSSVDLHDALVTSDVYCLVVDLGTDPIENLGLVDLTLAVEPDTTVVVVLRSEDHALGLQAVRAGAQDYLLRSASGCIDTASMMRTIHTAAERATRVVRTSREHRRMAKVLEHAADGYLVVDHSGVILTSSPSIARIWPDGFDHVETIFDALHPSDRDYAASLGVQALERPGTPAVGEVRALARDGSLRWFEIRLTDQTADPAIGGLITNVRDITDRVRSEQERHDAEERFRLGFENAAVGMTMSDLDGVLSQVNLAMCDILDRLPSELVGHRLDDFLHPDSPGVAPQIERLLAGEIDSFHGERRLLRPDGSVVWVLVTTVSVAADAAGDRYMFSQVQNITDRKQSEEALAHQAVHDALTGLPNRILLEERLESALAGHDRHPALLFIDVDNFKVINDGLGHTVGDRVLLELSDRLRANIRTGDTAARFGGDEFAVVLDGVPDKDTALKRAEHLLEVLGAPVVLGDQTHFVSVSIGCAVADGDSTAETVIRDADAAMYQAKALGRSRVELFTQSMHSQVARRLRTDGRLRHALEAGHFHVAYQPFLSIDDERVVGMEALLRWNDPDVGPVSPAEFIPVAEQTGLIVQLGAWALDEALRQLQEWRQHRSWGHGLSVSVNVSARQLSVASLVDTVQQCIVSNGIEAGALCLEITETAVMSDVEASIGLMRMMRDLGVDLSIDDFGTGYSSLNYLKSLPLNTLKVDRSFIDGLGSDPHDTSIVEAVVALGHALGMSVHAEGVEHQEQLDELRRIGCDDAQGWLWAPAMGAADFEAWMEARVSPRP